MIWLLPKLFRAIKKVIGFFINFFSGKKEPQPEIKAELKPDPPEPPSLSQQ